MWKAHADHNHISGRKRGLLCARCNQIAGYIENRPWVIDAVDYLDMREGGVPSTASR
jgi:hypothetical protein